MKHIIYTLSLLFFYAGSQGQAQDHQVDSLKAILQNTDSDTTKVNIYNQLAAAVFRSDPEAAIEYGIRARDLAGDANFQTGLALAYKNIGLGYYMQADYPQALKFWEPALEVYQQLGDEQGEANIIGNIGSIFYTGGNNLEAITYYIRALETAEKLGDTLRIGTLLLNIGNVYSEQQSTMDTALNYYRNALQVAEVLDYNDLRGLSLINIGELYYKKENWDSALFYFERSREVFTGDIDKASALYFTGLILAEQAKYGEALKNLEEALDMAKKENAQLEITKIYLGFAATYEKQGETRRAIEYYQNAESIAEEIGLDYELSGAYHGLAYNYAALRDYANAFRYLSMQTELDNAIYRIETESKTNNLMFSYQLEKKENEIALLEQVTELEQLKSRRQRAIIITVGSVGLLLLLLAVGLYHRMQFIRRTKDKMTAQKEEIEAQRNKIEAQRDKIQKQHDLVYAQKELITHSITYAERIQSAILPSQDMLKEVMPEYFVLFKPKDIVSGDFYWIKEVQDHLVIVEADCTGHGVPGAFMSMLGITMLNELIGDRCYDAPSAILEQMRMKVKNMLFQQGAAGEQKDGMDMALVILNKRTGEVHYSGANNPLYVIRNKFSANGHHLDPYFALDNGDYRLFEVKPDKQPIGVHWEETKFTTHSIQLEKGDTFYIFSDGFIDQFGGENRKKFKSLNFKKLLLSVQKEKLLDQKEIIEDVFDEWRGENEQIDDVSVVGVRI